MKQKTKNTTTIIILCILLLLMVVGYAAFSTTLNINGTATVTSNWEVKITDITYKNVIGGASNAQEPTYTDLTATFKTNLISPGDSIQYEITITNQGTIDAQLDNIELTDPENEAITFLATGINPSDTLSPSQSQTLIVTVQYNPNTQTQPKNTTSTLLVKLNYSQTNKN